MRNACWRAKEIVSDNMASLNINRISRSGVLIIIIGYWRLIRSIFEVQEGCDLDFVMIRKSILRRNQCKGDQRDRPLGSDAEEACMSFILTVKEKQVNNGYFCIFHYQKVHNNFEYLSK